MKQQIFLFLIAIQAVWMVAVNAQNPATNVDIQNSNITISASEDIRLSTGVSGKAYYNDKEIAVKSDVGRGATIVIAASNASEKSKSGADFVCTGNGDQEVFNTALNSLPECGGVIQLTEGNFHFYNTFWAVEKDVTIQGCGGSTVIHRHFVHIPEQFADFADSMFRTHPNKKWRFKDFTINSNNMETKGGYTSDIVCWNNDGGDPKGMCVIENVHVINGLVHKEGDMTISFSVGGINAHIINCSIQGNYTRSIRVSKENCTKLDVVIEGCCADNLVEVTGSNIFVSRNTINTLLVNSSGKSIITGNILQSLILGGYNILVANNIYSSINNQSSNSLVSSNLTPQ